ncbi:MAG: hypothetical protein P8J27_12070 [Mariniblastus sp.]|nr:hypothetical protein [Mariniblastus sp.]
MKFDKTFIAIRERSILETLDLSLHVLVDHFRPLFWLLVIGCGPWVVLDYLLLDWINRSEAVSPALYYWMMMLLVVSQAQVGTTFMTRYLGQAMFQGRPRILSTVKGVFKTSNYFIWSHGCLRCVVPVLLCCWLLTPEDIEVTWSVALILVPGLVIFSLFVRAYRPFVSEILLLERTPISKLNENQIYFSKRSRSLHCSTSSDLTSRFITVAGFAFPLTFSCFAFFTLIDSALNLRANMEFTFYPFYWIGALWIVAGFNCIVRFLSYIDLRIRQEGWAVELRMRAEGSLLTQALE